MTTISTASTEEGQSKTEDKATPEDSSSLPHSQPPTKALSEGSSAESNEVPNSPRHGSDHRSISVRTRQTDSSRNNNNEDDDDNDEDEFALPSPTPSRTRFSPSRRTYSLSEAIDSSSGLPLINDMNFSYNSLGGSMIEFDYEGFTPTKDMQPQVDTIREGPDKEENHDGSPVNQPSHDRSVSVENSEEEDVDPPESMLWKFRMFCGKIVNHEYVQIAVIIMILINALMMGLATFDFVAENERVVRIFDAVDKGFLVVFTVECAAPQLGWNLP